MLLITPHIRCGTVKKKVSQLKLNGLDVIAGNKYSSSSDVFMNMFWENFSKKISLNFTVFRAENDKSVAWLSSHACERGPVPWDPSLSLVAIFLAKPHKSCSFLFPSICLCLLLSVPSAGTPSNHLDLVAMVIVRTHLVSVTMAIGPLMSCLMSTALQSSFKVGVWNLSWNFRWSHAWVCWIMSVQPVKAVILL